MTLVRTTDGIAHLTAASRHDLFFAQGWVHAADRLFQADHLRRTASGTVAELLGPDALPGDVQLRTLGLRRGAERSWAAAGPRLRAAVTAYTDGMNARIRSGAPLPPEYGALGLTSVAPWTPVDSIVVIKLVTFQLAFELDIDLTTSLRAYVAGGAARGVDGRALFFENLAAHVPFSAASTVPDATRRGPAARAATGAEPDRAGPDRTELDRAALDRAAALAGRYRARAEKSPVLRTVLERDEHPTGSNEWVVSGRHTADGRPLLVNDPHLAVDSPSTFYPVHLVAPGIDAAGEGFAGVPAIAHGANRDIAWGSTVNPMDVTDTYLEEIRPDPASPSGLATVHQGRTEPVVAVPETFRANTGGRVTTVPPGDGIPAATLIVPRRADGPIIQLDQAAGSALSVQYAGSGATQELDALLGLIEARDLAGFRTALQSFDVGSQNWSYADRGGHIAYLTSAELPLREDLQAGTVHGVPPYLIRDGRGGNEWLPATHRHPGQALPYEILPPAEMPQLVDPPAGWFVNANNDPAGTTLDNDPLNQTRPGGGIYYLNSDYDGVRAGRVTELLTAALRRGTVDAADMARMQSDTVLIDAEFFAPRITAALARGVFSRVPELRALARDPKVAEAVLRMTAWDRSTPTGIAEGYDAADTDGRLRAPSAGEQADSVAATLYALWRSRFLAGTVDAVAARFDAPVVGGQRALSALRRAMSGVPSRSGVDLFAAPGVADPADRQALAVLRAVREGLDLLAGPAFAPVFGGSTRLADYRWGRLHRLTMDSPLGGAFSVPTGGGAFPPPLPGLAGIPTDGGFGTVDVAGHDLRGDSSEDFVWGHGPSRRYVGVLTATGPVGRNALPGGTSAIPGDRHYLDLVRPYLTNESYLVKVRPDDIRTATGSVTVLRP